MTRKIRTLMKNKFVKNVFIMVSGTFIAQMITVALSPIITRIYGPETYGLMGVFVSITSILIPIAALTYPVAMVLPKSDMKALKIGKLSMVVTVGFTIFISLIFILFSDTIVKVFNLEEVSSFLYLVPLVVLFSGAMQVIEQWLIRKKDFKIISKVSIIQAIILQSSKVGIGLAFPFAFILIILSALSNGLRGLMMFCLVKKSDLVVGNESEPRQSLKILSKEYIDFPLYKAPEAFISAVSINLPVLLLASFFGPVAVGYYSIGKTVLDLPSRLIGKAVGDVFYPHISAAANNGANLTRIISKATLSLSVIGIIPFGIIILFGPILFSVIFGEEWVVAGEYARWMALWVFFGFINKPSTRALPVLSAQFFQLKFTLIMLVVRVVALATGYYIFSSDIVAIALFSISSALLNLILIFITLKISKNFKKYE